jgi:hypothetical protein
MVAFAPDPEVILSLPPSPHTRHGSDASTSTTSSEPNVATDLVPKRMPTAFTVRTSASL